MRNKIEKTNAIRLLEQKKINFTLHTYEHGNEALPGDKVAQLLNIDPNKVFKTLVGIGSSENYFVFVIPVLENLNLKKVAKLAKEKSIELISVKELLPITGYIRGGCSPIGMKKQFKTFFHQSAINYDTIVFSGGKIGLQIEMSPKDVINLIKAEINDLIL